jgi:D-lactate dehydrogenase (cytochrome)
VQPRRHFHCSNGALEEQRSFKGQLYESVAQRLARERAEQRRFAEARGESGGGRMAAMTFGEIGAQDGRQIANNK